MIGNVLAPIAEEILLLFSLKSERLQRIAGIAANKKASQIETLKGMKFYDFG
jgi:hypothetical protein